MGINQNFTKVGGVEKKGMNQDDDMSYAVIKEGQVKQNTAVGIH